MKALLHTRHWADWFTLTAILDNWYYDHFHFIEEETDVQSGEAILPRPPNE